MKLTEEQVKEITVKVHKDLNLSHFDIYPVMCQAVPQSKDLGGFNFPTWVGSYDYRDPEAVGDEWMRIGSEYIITIDDEKGEAFAYHYYTGHLRIKLNENGKYEVVGKL
jgi:hypothetical protein